MAEQNSNKNEGDRQREFYAHSKGMMLGAVELNWMKEKMKVKEKVKENPKWNTVKKDGMPTEEGLYWILIKEDVVLANQEPILVRIENLGGHTMHIIDDDVDWEWNEISHWWSEPVITPELPPKVLTFLHKV